MKSLEEKFWSKMDRDGPLMPNKEFGVSNTMVYKIANHQVWSCVEG